MGTTNLWVRRLGEADAAAFRAIRLEGLLHDPRAFSASHEDEARHDLAYFARRLADNAIFGIDDDSGGLHAIAGLAVPGNAKQRHKGLVWGVYVRPAARGQRLATRLLTTIIDAARGHVESLHLAAGTYNQAAIACYRRLGFVTTAFEERALKVGDDYLDEITMVLRLDTGAAIRPHDSPGAIA